jgi:hypothetical protein
VAQVGDAGARAVRRLTYQRPKKPAAGKVREGSGTSPPGLRPHGKHMQFSSCRAYSKRAITAGCRGRILEFR